MVDKTRARIENLLRKSSALGKKDIMSLLSIKNNPLSVMIIRKYTRNGKLDVEDLIKSLYVFTNTRKLEEKLRFIFGLYDLDNDGYISNTELFNLLKLLSKGAMEDWKLQNIVDKTFAETGEYITRISYGQFEDLVSRRTENIYEFFDCTD